MTSPVPFPQRQGNTCDDIANWTLLWEDAWKRGNLKLDAINRWGLNKELKP